MGGLFGGGPKPVAIPPPTPAPPPPCDWTGFYVGVNVGGQFGHSEDLDHDYNVGFAGIPPDKPWGYNESGAVAGGQVGYNWQWNWLVLGPEFDVGYMSLDGRGIEPGSPGGDTRGESDGDFLRISTGAIQSAAASSGGSDAIGRSRLNTYSSVWTPRTSAANGLKALTESFLIQTLQRRSAVKPKATSSARA